MMLIFGGTTEGRLAVEVCEQAGKPYYYSTKSGMQQVTMLHGKRLVGAMDAGQMREFCQEHAVRQIVDAAHPFAENLHHTIATIGLPVIRLQRSFDEELEGIEYCDSFADAVTKLNADPPRLLLALSGANTISKLRAYWKQHPTVFRILDREESRDLAQREGLSADQLIYYKKDICTTKELPSIDEEKDMMQTVGCDAIITKESGESGGFSAKVQAAMQLGLRVIVVRHPQLPTEWVYVTGRHGLRRAIEHLLPDFFPLRTGFTTGACATAATKAALIKVLTGEDVEEVAFALPDGEVMSIPVEAVEMINADDVVASVGCSAKATVIKDFSDDPDVTKGCRITAEVELTDTDEIEFLQGEGVGTVTLPGLGIPVGGPAINATPRQMMTNEIRQLTDRGVAVTISVEGGEELAKRTFNPKVGVVGGISIIGTSGIVSPLSNEAFIQSICRELEVAKAIGCKEIAIASGKKGEEYLIHNSQSIIHNSQCIIHNSQSIIHNSQCTNELPFRCIHYGNFVGETLKAAHRLGFEKVTIGIMLGKAVKLAEGHLDTHSHKVVMNKSFLKAVAQSVCHESELESALAAIDHITLARQLWKLMPTAFFEEIRRLCLTHCRTVFPDGELEIHLICDEV